jgi:hypothetical protein
MSFKVGDIVRSYDFPITDDCYIEGIVRKIAPWEHCPCGFNHLHIEVTLDHFTGENITEDGREWVYPVDPTTSAIGFFPGGKASRVEMGKGRKIRSIHSVFEGDGND